MTAWSELENRRPEEIHALHLAFKQKIAEKAVDDMGISCPSASQKRLPERPKPALNIVLNEEPKPVEKYWFCIVDQIRKQPSVRNIQVVVTKHFNVSLTDLRSNRRTQPVAFVRQVAMHLTRITTKHSLQEIGRRFDRDHTSVIHGLRVIEAKIAGDPAFAAEVEDLRAEIEKGLAK